MKKPFFILASLFITGIFLFSACSTTPQATEQPAVQTDAATEAPVVEAAAVEEPASADTEAGEPAVGGTLRIGQTFAFDTLDPQLTWSGTADYLIFGSVLYYDADNDQYLPYLAESVTSSEDGLTYTIHFKEGILFHDGTPLTADDFVFTIERGNESSATGTYLTNFESVSALDDLTVEVKFSATNGDFINSLSSFSLAPLPREYVESQGDNFANAPVGAGPFVFDSYQTGEKLTLKRNPDFNWGPSVSHQGPAYIETVEIITITEYATLEAGLEAEELDLIMLENQDVERLRGLDYVELYQYSERGSGMHVVMNVEKEPFNNVVFRRAVNHILDRDALLKVVASGFAEPVYGPVSPRTAGVIENVEDNAYQTDLAAADALMQEAGYTKGADGFYAKDGVPLQITLINHFPTMQTTAEVLQEQFKQFGIQLEIQSLEFGVSIEAIQSGNFDMAIWGWASYNGGFLKPAFHSSQIGGLNLSRVNNPDLDAVLEQAISAPSFEKGVPYYQQAQQIIIDQAYILPMYNTHNFWGANKRIQNIHIDETILGWNIFDAYIEE